MRRAPALLFLFFLAAPPGRWFGSDKVKHFLMSFLVHSSAYSISRAAHVGRPGAQAAGVASAVTVGLLKEVYDKRAGKPFSIGDRSGTAPALPPRRRYLIALARAYLKEQ